MPLPSFLLQPWPWYIAGPSIGMVMLLLLYFDRSFGVSANFRTICHLAGAEKLSDYFRIDLKSQLWNITFVVGAVLGGVIAKLFLIGEGPLDLSPKVIEDLWLLGIDSRHDHYLPEGLFGLEQALSIKGFLWLWIGGLLVGFGARYAGGCTSGHAITGLSMLQLPSLIAVIGFFLGGLLMTHLLFPIFFS